MPVVVAAPTEQPGACAITRSSIGPFIDTFIDFDALPPYGRLYLCADVVGTMAQMLGWVPGERIAELTEQNRALRDELDRKNDALDAERAANAALVRAGYATTEEPAVAHLPSKSEKRAIFLRGVRAAEAGLGDPPADEEPVVGDDEHPAFLGEGVEVTPEEYAALAEIEAWVDSGFDDDRDQAVAELHYWHTETADDVPLLAIPEDADTVNDLVAWVEAATTSDDAEDRRALVVQREQAKGDGADKTLLARMGVTPE